MKEPLDQYIKVAIQGEIRRVGKYQVAHQKSQSCTVSPLNRISTNIDRRSQDMLIKTLRKLTPSYGIIAEEGSFNHESVSGRYWCIDPLDGSANYVSGLPLWCISLCLLDDFIPIFAITYIPSSDDMFCATRKVGAYLNGKKMHIQDRPLESVLFSFPIEKYQSRTILQKRLGQLGKISGLVGDIRVFNATCLELCYVASNKLGGLFVEDTASIWDVVGGMLIVEEAGGIVTNSEGLDLRFDQIIDRKYSVFAGSVEVHGSLLNIMKEKV